MIQVKCPGCGVTLKVKDALAGRTGKCPKCSKPIKIPRPSPVPDLSEFTEISDPDAGQAAEEVQEEVQADPILSAAAEDAMDSVPTASNAVGHSEDDLEPIPFDSLSDDEDIPSIIHPEGEAPGANDIKNKDQSNAPKKISDEQAIDPKDIPNVLGPLNHYIICDHKDVVARWESDGRGWMIRLRDGFTRATMVAGKIPEFGTFVLIEVNVVQHDDGLHIEKITPYVLARQYALTKLSKGEDMVLQTIIGISGLNKFQTAHVRELVKSKFLPRLHVEMENLLAEFSEQ